MNTDLQKYISEQLGISGDDVQRIVDRLLLLAEKHDVTTVKELMRCEEFSPEERELISLVLVAVILASITIEFEKGEESEAVVRE